MKSVLVILSLLLVQVASAGEWQPRILCDNGAFEVDGLHSNDKGYTDHQIVIRSQDAIAYFQSLMSSPIPLNAKGEVIAGQMGPNFSNSFEVQLAAIQFHGPGELLYHLEGNWVGSSYEVDLSSFSCTPGSCGPPPGSFLGKYIFNNCVAK